MNFPEDDYSINSDEFREIDLTEAATEFGEELDLLLAKAYMDGAVAIDLCWVADHRKPVPRHITWYDEPGRPIDVVDEPLEHIIRYDLETIDPGEFIDTLEESPYDWDDITEADRS